MNSQQREEIQALWGGNLNPITIIDPYGKGGVYEPNYNRNAPGEPRSRKAGRGGKAARDTGNPRGIGGMTAREVAGELHRRGHTPTDERNYAAPRLTELYKAGKIRTTGKKLCQQTGRNVAVWAIGKEV